ncbi:MAG: type II toxin-antitoxin system VapC family toxin [Myxococcales bacterium]|nr:type II toxin-antitoxin system VapC family toxin [Myxococcales bacterium]
MYVFDTDVLSLLMKGKLPGPARTRLTGVPRERARTTTVTLGELYYGALRSSATARWLAAVDQLRALLTALPFDEAAARQYGELRAFLEARGRRLDDADLRIAAICRANDHILVSANARHFARVPGLRFENWLR